MITRYHVPAGTQAWRSKSNAIGIQFTTAVWDKFVTTKDTYFGSNPHDRINQPTYQDAGLYYYFRLPKAADPWCTLIVWKEDVVVTEVPSPGAVP